MRFDGTSRTVVDGPFTGDLVAGYWLLGAAIRRGDGGVGQALPEPDAGTVGDRDQADLRRTQYSIAGKGCKGLAESAAFPQLLKGTQ